MSSPGEIRPTRQLRNRTYSVEERERPKHRDTRRTLDANNSLDRTPRRSSNPNVSVITEVSATNGRNLSLSGETGAINVSDPVQSTTANQSLITNSIYGRMAGAGFKYEALTPEAVNLSSSFLSGTNEN